MGFVQGGIGDEFAPERMKEMKKLTEKLTTDTKQYFSTAEAKALSDKRKPKHAQEKRGEESGGEEIMDKLYKRCKLVQRATGSMTGWLKALKTVKLNKDDAKAELLKWASTTKQSVMSNKTQRAFRDANRHITVWNRLCLFTVLRTRESGARGGVDVEFADDVSRRAQLSHEWATEKTQITTVIDKIHHEHQKSASLNMLMDAETFIMRYATPLYGSVEEMELSTVDSDFNLFDADKDGDDGSGDAEDDGSDDGGQDDMDVYADVEMEDAAVNLDDGGSLDEDNEMDVSELKHQMQKEHMQEVETFGDFGGGMMMGY